MIIAGSDEILLVQKDTPGRYQSFNPDHSVPCTYYLLPVFFLLLFFASFHLCVSNLCPSVDFLIYLLPYLPYSHVPSLYISLSVN